MGGREEEGHKKNTLTMRVGSGVWGGGSAPPGPLFQTLIRHTLNGNPYIRMKIQNHIILIRIRWGRGFWLDDQLTGDYLRIDRVS